MNSKHGDCGLPLCLNSRPGFFGEGGGGEFTHVFGIFLVILKKHHCHAESKMDVEVVFYLLLKLIQNDEYLFK